NLYFHAMADNRGVLIKLASRAAEEDMKEEILLYAVLAKGPVRRSDLPEVDRVIERYMEETFGVDVDFEIEDALERLIAEGIVSEAADGTLHTLPPAEAARLIDRKWDAFLDLLPGSGEVEGTEMRDGNVVQANVSATACRFARSTKQLLQDRSAPEAIVPCGALRNRPCHHTRSRLPSMSRRWRAPSPEHWRT